MCKAMASEKSSSIVGKEVGLAGSQQQQPEAPAASAAALTAADPQIGASLPGPGLQLLPASLSTLQQSEASAFEAAGAAHPASPLGALPQSSAGPMTSMMSGPSTSSHSQSTELLFQPSTTSTSLSGFSLTAGLPEAMQHMRLQSTAAAGPGSTQLQQQPGGPAAAAAAASGPASAPLSAAAAEQLHGQIAHSESQSSADIAQLLGHAQQQHAQQQQEQGSATEDGPATVRTLVLITHASVPSPARRSHAGRCLCALLGSAEQALRLVNLLCHSISGKTASSSLSSRSPFQWLQPTRLMSRLHVVCSPVLTPLLCMPCCPAAVLCQGAADCHAPADPGRVCAVWRSGVSQPLHAV